MQPEIELLFLCRCLMSTCVSSPPFQMGNEEQQERLLREWLDCCVTEGGVLVALQKSSRRRNHPLVTQMVEKWLDGYRQIRPCASLSDGEEEEEEDDEWRNWSGGRGRRSAVGGEPDSLPLLHSRTTFSFFCGLFVFLFPDTDKLWKPSGEDKGPPPSWHLLSEDTATARAHAGTRTNTSKNTLKTLQTSLGVTDRAAARHRKGGGIQGLRMQITLWLVSFLIFKCKGKQIWIFIHRCKCMWLFKKKKKNKELYQHWLRSTLYMRSVWALTKAHFQIDLFDSFSRCVRVGFFSFFFCFFFSNRQGRSQ